MVILPIGMVFAGALLAAEVGGGSFLPGWAEGGLALVIIVAYSTDKVVTGRKYEQAIKERDEERARTEKAEAIAKELLTDQVFPALTETQITLRTVSDRVLPLLERVMGRLDELEREAG